MIFLTWALISSLLFVMTFVFFVAIITMRNMRDNIYKLHWSVRWICYLILFIGLILDTAMNWIMLTVVFVEFPKEFLSTARVVRIKYDDTGWRQSVAIFFCKNFLTPFDENHCVK